MPKQLTGNQAMEATQVNRLDESSKEKKFVLLLYSKQNAVY